MTEKVIPVILAGGSGSRLWPLSRKERPKQFFDPDGNGSLLLRTLRRAKAIAVDAAPVIIASAVNAEAITRELAEEEDNYELIAEPFAVGTTAAIALVTVTLQKRGENGILVFLPADHFIPDTELFCADIGKAAAISRQKKAITVLGIKPRYPATGFGYAEAEKVEHWQDISYGKVKRFVEKPHRERARRYVKKGTYYWNSGITLCPLAVMADVLNRNYSGFDLLTQIEIADYEGLTACYRGMENIPFDCCVLEKEKPIYLLKAEFPWYDVGTFQNLAAMIPQDENGNVVKGNTVLRDVNSSVIVSDTLFTAVIGVRDLVVIAIDGILLVCPRRKAEEVRDIVDALKDENEKYK